MGHLIKSIQPPQQHINREGQDINPSTHLTKKSMVTEIILVSGFNILSTSLQVIIQCTCRVHVAIVKELPIMLQTAVTLWVCLHSHRATLMPFTVAYPSFTNFKRKVGVFLCTCTLQATRILTFEKKFFITFPHNIVRWIKMSAFSAIRTYSFRQKI